MDPLYGLILFGVSFFGFMVVVGVVKARRSMERAYYIGAIMGARARQDLWALFLISWKSVRSAHYLLLIKKRKTCVKRTEGFS